MFELGIFYFCHLHFVFLTTLLNVGRCYIFVMFSLLDWTWKDMELYHNIDTVLFSIYD